MGPELVVVRHGDAAEACSKGGLDNLLRSGLPVLGVDGVDVEVRLHLTPAPSVMGDSTVA